MGVLSAIGNRWRRWRVARRSREYADPKLVERVLNSPPEPLAAERRPVDFIVALLRDDDLDALPDRLRRVTELVPNWGGILEILVGPLVLITFGAWRPDPKVTPDARRQQRVEVVARLRSALGNEVRLLHGRGAAIVGDFGTNRYSSFGTILEGFGDLLRNLVTLEAGESRE